jgi:hypothetical protein
MSARLAGIALTAVEERRAKPQSERSTGEGARKREAGHARTRRQIGGQRAGAAHAGRWRRPDDSGRPAATECTVRATAALVTPLLQQRGGVHGRCDAWGVSCCHYTSCDTRGSDPAHACMLRSAEANMARRYAPLCRPCVALTQFDVGSRNSCACIIVNDRTLVGVSMVRHGDGGVELGGRSSLRSDPSIYCFVSQLDLFSPHFDSRLTSEVRVVWSLGRGCGVVAVHISLFYFISIYFVLCMMGACTQCLKCFACASI